MGNIGATLVPFVLENLSAFWMNMFYLIINGISMALLFFLPETVGKPMVESIRELDEEENEQKKFEEQVINNTLFNFVIVRINYDNPGKSIWIFITTN